MDAPKNLALAGSRVIAGRTWSTILPAMDFETYSEAGYAYDEDARKWRPTTPPPYGLKGVGASAYSEHPSTEILSLAYDLKDGQGPRLWIPALEPPEELFDHLARGRVVEAWNSSFEWYIWNNVATRLGWPRLSYLSLRDAMAKALAHSLPAKLEKAGEALSIKNQKIKDGTRLLTKFSKPRKPTKKDPSLRLRPEDDPVDGPKLYEYNIGDIRAESEISAMVPDLSPVELDLWLFDQRVNFRGMAIDLDALAACTAIVDQATAKYTQELFEITGGTIDSVDKTQKIRTWLEARCVHTDSLDMEHVENLLKQTNIPSEARRVLEIRQVLGSASVKKLRAINNRISADGRLRDMFQFCGAQRTGRFAGRGPQPHNLPNSGPKTRKCGCGRHSGADNFVCPWCGRRLYNSPLIEWNLTVAQDALLVIGTHDLETVEQYFGDAIPVVMGCLRALFVAGPDRDLICSDYSAIEAVILAEIAGETWRQEVFRTHGKIYEMSASMITGVPFEEFLRHKEETGDHHPLRKKLGKVAELASGYQGWLGAWIAFGADKYLNEEEIKTSIIKWRAASPAIVALWAGLNDAAICAIERPGLCFSFRGIRYGVLNEILYCQLPSGRCLTYHKPQIHVAERYGKPYVQITYMGWNADPKKGPLGWARLETYGGKLTENVVQAIARDVLVFGMLNAERAGYPIVLHVHDEPVAEVRKDFGSVEEFERIISTMPPWARGWPIKAVGGWRGRQYRKD